MLPSFIILLIVPLWILYQWIVFQWAESQSISCPCPLHLSSTFLSPSECAYSWCPSCWCRKGIDSCTAMNWIWHSVLLSRTFYQLHLLGTCQIATSSLLLFDEWESIHFCNTDHQLQSRWLCPISYASCKLT